MTARTRQAAACLEAAERDIRAMQTGMVLDGIWQNAGLSAFVNECGRYADDPDYRAKVDADRAARQAEVHARMDAGIARFRAEREAGQ